ncbi:hypothetical protein ACFSRY_13130 [Pontibacter locisalis]|uniref:GGDEF domain-containing protein n=1 Tax=Pontibacter locisalis TaxID=1719035 RepID=A0ABW5IPA0_9BACT
MLLTYLQELRAVIMNLERPPLITGMCILGVIGFVTTLPAVLGFRELDVGISRPYLAFSAVMGLASLIGFWYMNRWGLYLYFGMLLLNQAMMIFVFRSWNEASLLVPSVAVFTGIWYYDRMT